MITLIKSTFYKEKATKKALCDFITKSGHLSFGAECERFETAFAVWQKRTQCVFLNSGSSANLALIQSLINLGRLQPGDSVGFSAVTWSTNVMPIIELGLVPVPIDAEIDTLNVSSKQLLEVLKHHHIKALFLTNLLGFCDDIDEIAKICRKNNIILLEDSCEALGSVYKQRRLGNWGLAGTFSFYVGHHMSTIEGGAVATDDEELATMLRLVRAHGWDRNLTFSKQEQIRNTHRVNSTFYSRYTFYELGYNLRPTEIAGFLGNVQLGYIDEIIKKRETNFIRFHALLYKNTKRYYPLHYRHMDIVSNFAVPLVCRSEEIRDGLVKQCEGKIEIRPIVGGDMTKQPFFAIHEGKKYSLPNASLIHSCGLYFGNNPELTDDDIQTAINIFASD
jgi:CDP-4-dehydro-6-deoxyglucose reductase, E1